MIYYTGLPVGALDIVSTTGISLPGLSTTSKLYSCIFSNIDYSLFGAFDSGLEHIATSGLWSVTTVTFLP